MVSRCYCLSDLQLCRWGSPMWFNLLHKWTILRTLWPVPGSRRIFTPTPSDVKLGGHLFTTNPSNVELYRHSKPSWLLLWIPFLSRLPRRRVLPEWPCLRLWGPLPASLDNNGDNASFSFDYRTLSELRSKRYNDSISYLSV